MLDKQKQDQYIKFKDSIFYHNHANTAHISVSDPVHDPDSDPDTVLDRARAFINKIKEHRHDKIKTKQINKFQRLYYKIHGYHHNLTRHNHLFDNTDHNSSILSSQPNVPSSISPRFSTTSTTSNVPATPRPPHLPPAKQPPKQHQPTPPVATLQALIHVETKWTNGSSTSQKPPLPANSYPYYKKVQTMPSPPNTPNRSLHHGH